MPVKRVISVCHICGELKELTFEHVPPRSAFNNSRVLYSFYKPGQDLPPPLAERRGSVQQKGLGAYTLCRKCNNDTGAWYGSHFAEYCKAGMEVLETRPPETATYIENRIELSPLAVLKQIASMFLSINPVEVRSSNLSLVDFVREKENRMLDSRYRFFTYLNRTGIHRISPITGVVSFDRRTMQFQAPRVLSEFSFPPYGYIMTFDSSSPQRDLLEITHFKDFSYEETATMALTYPVYETNSVYPLDYRSNEELKSAIANGKREMGREEGRPG